MIDVDDDDNFNVKTIELTNRMWFSVVFTRNDNGMRYHSGQNDADSRGAAEWVHHNINVKEIFFPEKGIALHLEAGSVVWVGQISQSDC